MSYDRHSPYSNNTPISSPYHKRFVEKEIEPYAPIVVEDLIQNGNEWRGVADIVRISLKALTDVVRTQGETLRDLEKQMSLKTGKAELNNGLAAKAIMFDVNKSIAEFATDVNNKCSWDELKLHLREYVLRSDLQYELSLKPSFEEVREILQGKGTSFETEAELNEMLKSISDKIGGIEMRISEYVTHRELNNFKASVETKNALNPYDLNDILDLKANKQSVANALHKKANKADLESALSQKFDKLDALTLEQRIDQLARKMDLLSLRKDELQDLNGTIDQKVNRADFEEVLDTLSRQKVENQRFAADLEHLFEVVKNDLESVRQNNQSPKIDVDEIEKILQILNRKPDIDQVNVSLIKLRDEVSEEINAVKEAILSQIKEMETESLKKATQADALYEEISLEVRELNDQIRKVLDDKSNKKQLEDTNTYVNKALQEFQNDIIEELKRIDEKSNQISHELNIQIRKVLEDKSNKRQLEDTNAYVNKTLQEFQNDIVGELKRIDDKCNQISHQKDDQIKELGNYLQRIPETLKAEVQEEIQKIADVVTRMRNSREGQGDETNKVIKRVVEGLQQELRSEVDRLEDKVNQMKGIRDAQFEDTNKGLKKAIDSIKQELYGELQRMDGRLNQAVGQINETIQKKKSDAGEFEGIFSRIQEQLESKTELAEVQEVLNGFSQEISKKFLSVRDDFTQLFKEHEQEVFTALKKKANITDVNAAIAKLENTLMNWIENFENSQQKVQKVQERQASQESLNYFRQQIDALHNELQQKLNIDDAMNLLNSKANIEEFNKIIKNIQADLEERATQEELRNIVADQALINESLCTENILGRWAWRSGEIDNSGLVPWDMQMTNTLPDNFLWEKDTDHVIAVAPGLYEIAYGFFSQKKPAIKLLINDEVIFSSWSQEKLLAGQKSFEIPQHRNKESYGGLTGIEFVTLPPRAKISISYGSEPSGEGFLSLKRL